MTAFDYKSVHILLIDDEPFVIKLLDRVLKELGTGLISTAVDGSDGLHKLEMLQTSRRPVDVVVCDVEMPVMDGLEFVKKVRTGVPGVRTDLPIVVLTGHSDEETVLQAIGLKIDGYVVKPVSPKTLDRRLRAALGQGPSEKG